MPSSESQILAALEQFAESVTAKFQANAPGEPEDQLRAPTETLLQAAASTFSLQVVAKGESTLSDRLGRPDYAILVNGALAGHLELKEPGKTARPERFGGHDKRQWERFKSLPNVLYSDGNEWALYRSGEKVSERPVRLSGDITIDGKAAATLDTATHLTALLRDFLSWQPVVPSDAQGFAAYLAPLCRLLRREVEDALEDPQSLLHQLAADWRRWLFPDADDARFADAYAQTVTFALLLARSEGARTESEDLSEPIQKLAAGHALLSRALQVLTDAQVREEIRASLRILQRVIDAVDPFAFKATTQQDPWLYFYEDFLAAYDPNLRRNAGVYYTPIEVVHAQVRLADDLLRQRLGLRDGLGDPSVNVLDPATGTGTYLLAALDHVLGAVVQNQGAGAASTAATQMAKQLFGFEVMTGPFSVAELRLSRALTDRGATLPPDGVNVFLADTLESPDAQTVQPPLILRPLAEQHERAMRVKATTPVLVCIANPPYDRHPAADARDAESRARTGGWVRWGNDADPAHALLNDFSASVRAAGRGGQLKNLYNLYVYFWRWALWKVFEHDTPEGPGIVTFISASSYLGGEAFLGMREWMRRQCDEIWIIDLGGEGRGTRQDENVFAIQTPVAICVAIRHGAPDPDTPARVNWARIDGSREDKLAALERLQTVGDLAWDQCPAEWRSPFRPRGAATYFDWPELIDLFPWQQSGVKAGRIWPISPDVGTLNARWRELLAAAPADRPGLFVDRPTGRKATDRPPALPPATGRLPAITEISATSNVPAVCRYAYRSFDRQHLLADSRLLDRPGPALWAAHGPDQVYLSTLLNHPLGGGPALTAASDIPDLHHFRGSFGAREVIPAYRDAAATSPNVTHALLELLSADHGEHVSFTSLLAYVYALLAQPAFTLLFEGELLSRELRVPITRDAKLFGRAADVGTRLLWLHTYGQRFTGPERPPGPLATGRARCTTAVPGSKQGFPNEVSYDETTQRLLVGAGVFEPVEPEVYEFEVSGFKVVQSWLGYRIGTRGQRSSPLDDIRPEVWTHEFTRELLELLWLLEQTVEGYAEQEQLLDEVLAGPLFSASELPPVPKSAREAPRVESVSQQLLDL